MSTQIKRIELTVFYPGTDLPPSISRHEVLIRPLSRPLPNGLNENGVSFAVLGRGLAGSGPDIWGIDERGLRAEQVASNLKRSNGKPIYDSARWV